MEIIFNSIDEMIEYIKVSLPKGAKVTLRSGGDAEQPAYKPKAAGPYSSRGPKPSAPRASARPSTGKPPAKSKKPFAPKGSKRGQLSGPGKFSK